MRGLLGMRSFWIFPGPKSLFCLLWFQSTVFIPAFVHVLFLYIHRPRGQAWPYSSFMPPQCLGQGLAFRRKACPGQTCPLNVPWASLR